MKKRFRTITALVMIAFMALSSSAVFADDLPGFERVDGEPATSQQVDQDMGAKVVDEELPGEEVSMKASEIGGKATSCSAKYLKYDNTAKPDYRTLNVPNSSDYVVAANIKAEATGLMYMDVKNTGSDYADIVLGTYSNGKITYSSSYGWAFMSAGDTRTMGPVAVTAGKTYCIGARSSSNGNKIQFRPYVYSTATRTLTVSSNWMLSPGWSRVAGDYTTISYKIVPSKTGYINVQLKDFGEQYTYGNILLLNSKKKVVSDKVTYSVGGSYPSKVVFGVKKGVTYYLKVTDCMGGSDNNYVYGIKYSIKAGKVGKSSKSKAVKLKKGKYVSKIMLADNKSGSQWFKFKVTKKSKVQVNIDATNIVSGTVKVKFYRGKKEIGAWTVYGGEVNKFSTSGKAPKGTYYVKITKSKKASGQYRIKYVK